MKQTNEKGNTLADSSEDEFEVKKTVLDDSAEIYDQHHMEEDNVKKTWKELNRADKWQFFKDYYLLKLIIMVIACSFVVYVLKVTFGPHTEKIFYAAVLQDNLDTDGVNTLESDLSDLLQAGDHQIVSIDTSFNFSDQNTTFSGSDKLTTILYSGLIDVIIASPDEFEQYSYYGYLKNLSTYLPADIQEGLADYFITAQVNQDEEDNDQAIDDAISGTNTEMESDTTSKEYVLGIDLTKSEKYMALNPETENPVLCIAYNAPNKENTFKAIRYLFDLPEPDEEN